MKTSELYEKEIGYIKNPTLQKITKDVLDSAPECIQTIPASSTGKYHPAYSLGEGGLMRHVKGAVGIAHSLMQTDNFRNIVFGNGFEDIEQIAAYKDCAYVALILHDSYKPDDTSKHSTRFDHPILAANAFKKAAKKYINNQNVEYMKLVVPLIFNAIASHMGEWSELKYAPGVVLPKPKCGLDNFVHLCDYLGSRKFLEFNFDVYNEVGR